MSKSPEITLVDYYNKRLDEIDQVALGIHKASGPDEKRKLIFSWVGLFNNILNSKQDVVNETLSHFLDNIDAHMDAYDFKRMFASIYTMKTKDIPNPKEINKTIELMNFFIGIVDNKNDIKRYLDGWDIPYLFRNWTIPQREALLNFFITFK